MTDYVIRAVQASDCQQIVELWSGQFPTTKPWHDPQIIFYDKLKSHDGLFHVAASGERILGTVMAGFDGFRGWIYKLAVAADCQRKGIGTRLIDHAENSLRDRGCRKINLQILKDNLTAIEFYQNRGYEIENRIDFAKGLLDSHSIGGPEELPRIPIDNAHFLSAFRHDDRDVMVEHLSATSQFHENTAQIPYPYTYSDATAWLEDLSRHRIEQDNSCHWAIRTRDGRMIGAIGIRDLKICEKVELGYWVARAFWRKGIATAGVRAVCSHCFEEFNVIRIHAHVLAHNVASCRVLEKAGFEKEGVFRQHFFREGRAYDIHFYGMLRPK